MTGQHAKVLVIDDQPFFTTMLRNVLEQQGFEVVSAGSGAEGLEQARAHRPAAILLDVEMPGLDGFAVCRRLKQDPALKAIPVIILTASDDTKLNEKAFGAGADITALKSVSGDRLVNMLQLALSRGEATGE